MPVPIRDDGSPGPSRRLLVFVHGFYSSPETWKPVGNLLAADPDIKAAFELQYFSYRTGLTGVPAIPKLAAELVDFLEKDAMRPGQEDKYIDITLIGHSMGGLVIQSALLQWLAAGQGAQVGRIRQVILFATPNFGSGIASGLRRAISTLIHNAQNEALHLFSEETRHIEENIRSKVVFVRDRGPHQYPVPFHCFWGEDDDIVNPVSAQGIFSSSERLPGTHFTVHSAQAFDKLKAAILCPHSHTNITEIDSFRFCVKVWPLAQGTVIHARHGIKERDVICDNAARIIREVTFGQNNHCMTPFELKYGTRNGGWLEVKPPLVHCTLADKKRLYDDNGVDAFFQVPPTASTTATLECTVYKGFDHGHRNFHMHLGRDKYFRRLSLEVDLSEYVQAGWQVTAPQLYYQPIEPENHDMCDLDPKLPPDPAHEVDSNGIWRWELEYLKEGVVDFKFDVQPPVKPAGPAPVIQLGPGEHAMFGYGSLLSVASMERTLQRRYTGPSPVCTLPGWRRTWDVAMKNTRFFYSTPTEFIRPEKIFYLNIRPDQTATINGLLFVVTQAELEKFDERELVYDRVDITDQLQGAKIEGGQAWVYVAKPEWVFPRPATPKEGAIRQTYLDILATGHRNLGPAFTAAYDASTDPVPLHLVIPDEQD